MTRERCKELLPIMQAFAEGKEIEVLKMNEGWKVEKCPLFESDARFYRIKPTEEFRPYKDCDEMIADYKRRLAFVAPNIVDLPLIWVKHKTSGGRQLIITFHENTVDLSICREDMQELFEDYTYLDDSPIGVKL